MTAEQFDSILSNRLERIKATLASKAGEYATTNDRLHNFKRAAAIQGTSPAQALEGMWTKHLVSVLDMIESDANGKPISDAIIDEKIGDSINYLILLEAILIEGCGKRTTPTT